ncbi:MAG: hypothetical protein IT488_08950 [Gammaproteobacteria bacterium]|nr:hypothetical protein [Gammaproteobacteria bacterium]
MRIYVKEWPNRAATLYSDAGEELCTFPSIESALALCLEGAVALNELLGRGDIGAPSARIDVRSAA